MRNPYASSGVSTAHHNPASSFQEKTVTQPRLHWLLLLFMGLLWTPASISAQDETEEEEELDVPLVMMNVASFDRVHKEVDKIFGDIDRTDVADFLAEQLGRVDNLAGLDRSKPFGQWFFMKGGFPPQFIPVFYFPVADEKAMQNAKYGELRIKPAEGEQNIYEISSERDNNNNNGGIQDPNGNRRRRRPRGPAKMLIKDGYAFVAPPFGGDAFLDLNLPNPEKLTRSMTSRYDVSIAYDLTSIPKATLQVFIGFLKNAAETELQQRDDEPDGAYKIRRANGVSILTLLEQAATQTERVVIGVNKSKNEGKAIIEASVHATPGSDFAKYLKAIGGKRSYFDALNKEDSPFTVSVSWALDTREKKSALETLEGLEEEIGLRLLEEGEQDPAFSRLFEILRETADAGHVDILAQMVGNPEDKFVFVGGMKLVGGNGFATSLEKLIDRLSDIEALNAVELNVDSHAGMQIHRIQGKQIRREDKRLYGNEPSLYIGSTAKAVWFAVGEDQAISALKDAMDTVTQAQRAGRNRTQSAPLTITINAGRWLGLGPVEGEEDRPRPLDAFAKEAFTPENDEVKLEVQTTDDGARVRIEVNEGFLRLLGLALSGQYDKSQQ